MEITITRNVLADELRQKIPMLYGAFEGVRPKFAEPKAGEKSITFSFDALGIPLFIEVILGSVEFRGRIVVDGAQMNEVKDRYSRINSIINGFTIGFDDETKKTLMKYKKKDRIIAYVVITGLSFFLKNLSALLSTMLDNGYSKETITIDDSQLIDVDVSEFHSSDDPLVAEIVDGLKFIDYIIIRDPNPPEWLVNGRATIKAIFRAEVVRFKDMAKQIKEFSGGKI